ncbi:MAG: hypothetical protein U1F54_04855 [Burkholderiales bacterium]
MGRLLHVGVATVALIGVFPHAMAQGDGLRVPLPSADLAALESLLGPGVVGKPIPAFPIPSAAATPSAKRLTYRLTSGPDAKASVTVEMSRVDAEANGRKWRYAIGTRQLGFLNVTPGERLGFASLQDNSQGILTRFNPAEPLIVAGMNAGDEQTLTSAIAVYDLGNEDTVQHTGTLALKFSYVGAYQVRVPAGTYRAALLKWSISGKVGAASIQDIQYRLVTADGLIVAAVDHRDIAAMLLYSNDTQTGRVLLVRP